VEIFDPITEHRASYWRNRSHKQFLLTGKQVAEIRTIRYTSREYLVIVEPKVFDKSCGQEPSKFHVVNFLVLMECVANIEKTLIFLIFQALGVNNNKAFLLK
jgi:hypothetical protein